MYQYNQLKNNHICYITTETIMKIPEKLLVFCLVLSLPSNLSSSSYSQQDQDLNYLSLIKKKFTSLPECKWNYKYDIGRSIVAALCFLSASFVLIFGELYISKI